MANLHKILTAFAVSLFIMGGASALKAENQTLGTPEQPHGYPAWFSDSNGLQLELCLGNITNCFFDPPIAGNTFSEQIGFGGEAFWLLAEAEANMAGGGTATLTLALEAAFGGDEAVVDGNQVSFGRVRIRFDDVTVPGNYRVTHPYGILEFNDIDVTDERPVNYTKDIGGANPADPAAAFSGTLTSDIMSPGNIVSPLPFTSFITWPNYASDPLLLIGGKRYIGDGNTPHTIVGSPTGFNLFRVEWFDGANWVVVAETPEFVLQGRVFDPTRPSVPKTMYANIPAKNLRTVGPVNRETHFLPGSTAIITGADFVPGYPIGYPLWYGDASGLKLTITFPPMGISEPIDPPGVFPLNTAGETFYWSASASFDTVPAAADLDPLVEFAVEGTFGGDEAVVDGNQISFGRLRIRIDTPTAGTYTVTHPYGSNTFEVDSALLEDGINYTQDIGAANPFDPDAAFHGTLYSRIGPNFLTWNTFNRNPSLNDPLLQKDNPADPTGPKLQYVGDPAIAHAVKGGTYGNIVRIQGPGGIDVQTNLFTITGQVFSAGSLGFLPANYMLLLEE